MANNNFGTPPVQSFFTDESAVADVPLSLIEETSGVGSAGNTRQDNIDAVYVAFLSGEADEDDPLANLDQHLDKVKVVGNADELISALGEQAGAQALSSLMEQTIEMNTPEAGAAAMKETVDLMQSEESEWRAMELAVSNQADPIEAEIMAYEYNLARAGKMMAKSGAWDTVLDWAGVLAWSADTLVEIPEFVQKAGATSFKAFVEQYQALTPAEKVAQFGAIQKLAEEVFDENQVKAFGALMAILNPLNDEEHSVTGMRYETFERTFGALELYGWVKTATAMAQRANAVRLAMALKNPQAAGRINKGVLEGHPNAGVTNVSQETAAANTLGIDLRQLDIAMTKGVAPETVRAIEKERADLMKLLEELQQSNIERSALTPIEEALAQQNALNKFGAWASEMEKKGWIVENARIGNADKNGFEVFYDLAGPDETVWRPKPIPVKYTFDDVGQYQSIEMGIGSTNLLSVSRLIEDIDPVAVDVASAIIPTQDKIIRVFDDAMKSTWKPLNKYERAKLDEILLKGDALTKQYTIKELEMLGMNLKQITAYYKSRDLLDVLHQIKNKTTRDQMAFEGWKGGSVTEIAEESSMVGDSASVRTVKRDVEMPVRPVGPGVLKERDVNVIYNGTDPSSYKLSVGSVKFEKMLDNTDDFTLVEFHRPIKVGNESFTIGIVKKSKVKELPASVVQKRDGYVPLIRDGVQYAVKSTRKTMMNGRKQSVLKVERLFDDKAEADKYAREFSARNPGIEARVISDGELTADDIRDIDIVNHGGLYGTPRTDKDILFGLDGVSKDRVSAVDAMARNMSHVANRLPMNQFRIGHIQRFINSYGKYLERPNNWNSAFKADTPMQIVKGGESMRTFIKDLSRIPTPEEISWGWHMRKIGEFVQGKGMSGTGRYIANLGHKDPWAAMRAVSFYLQLGFFRLDQLFVQSAGASIAMSIHPTYAPKAIANYMAVRYAHALENPAAVSKLEGLLGYKKGELVDLVNDWDKAGLIDSIRNNADYNAATLGLNIDAGMVSRITEAGLLPFKEGELFAQGIGWMIARAKYMDERKLKKLSDADLDKVFGYSKTISLNLSRANRAAWQKGFFSLPTQFMQIQAKFFEQMSPAMIGGATKVDAAAKARVWAGQLFLFGAAGVPFFKYALNSALEAAGYDPTSASEEVKAWLAGGLAEFMTQVTFGQRFDVAGRMSIPSGIEQLVRDIFIYDTPITDTILGAFGSVPHRAFQAFANTAHILKSPTEYEWNWDLVSTVGEEYASVMASFNNFHKARLWYKLGVIRDNQGRNLDVINDETGTALLVGKAVGFQPRLVTDYYDLKEWNTNNDKFNKEKVEAIRRLVLTHLSKNPDDPVNRKNYETMMALITADIPSEDQRNTVIKEALAPLFDEETAINRALKKYYANAMETGTLDSINGTISGSVGQSSLIKKEEDK